MALVIILLLLSIFILIWSRRSAASTDTATEDEKSETQKGPLQPTVKYKYRRKNYIMSTPENNFFETIVGIVGNEYYVFPQVYLSSILDGEIWGQNWKGARSSIDRKSVDYVVCNKGFRQPLLAIELDDSSHDKDDRQQRDVNVEHILAQAGMPLVRFRNVRNLSHEEIASKILSALPASRQTLRH